jgi:hypothetical protein
MFRSWYTRPRGSPPDGGGGGTRLTIRLSGMVVNLLWVAVAVALIHMQQLPPLDDGDLVPRTQRPEHPLQIFNINTQSRAEQPV